MHLTGNDIESLKGSFEERLKKGVEELPAGAMTMSAIQDWMLKHRVESPEVLISLIEKAGKGIKAAGAVCPRCGAKLKFQGYRRRKIHTGRTGVIELNRAYYTCTSKKCDYVVFPLDEILALSPNKAAGKFEDQICRLAATEPFEHVRSYLERYDGVSVSETMIRESAERCGQALIRKEEEEAQTERFQRPAAQRRGEKPADPLYCLIDAGKVPMRAKSDIDPREGSRNERNAGEDSQTGDSGGLVDAPVERHESPKAVQKVEYRDVRVGLVFRDDELEKSIRNGKQQSRIKKKRFVTSIDGSVPYFEMLLRRLLGRCGAWHAKVVVFVTDGAIWIDHVRERLLPNSVHILDWYHCVEHLYTCARAIYGEAATVKIMAWVKPLETLLWEGRAAEVCDRLLFEIPQHPKHETELRELHSYYHSRRDKMRYPEFLAKGYFIGSGPVESSMKYLIQSRLKQAGMKWTVPGACAIIKLREKIYENSWKQTWDAPLRHFSYG